MIVLGDFHTHTIYSSGKHNSKHAVGTIFQNAFCAKQKGLITIGISEHGFSHKFFGLQKQNIAKMRTEIEQAEKELEIKILLGVEANIISENGDIDISEDELKLFDYIIVGYHSFAKAKTLKSFFSFFLPNNLGFKRKKDIDRNTTALCKAMEKYPISFISHPGSRFPVDFTKICQTANKTKTLLEINGSRICYSKNDVETIIKSKTKLIVNSDAHKPERVGEVNYPINFIIKNNIPNNLIVNFNELKLLKSVEK